MPFSKLKSVQGFSQLLNDNQASTFNSADGETFIKDAYKINPHVFSAVNKVIEKASLASYILYDDTNERERVGDHAILNLLNRPNPMQGLSEFIETVWGFKQITGESFIHIPLADSGPDSGMPVQMWNIPSILITKIEYDVLNRPLWYVVGEGVNQKKFPAEEIIHWKGFNPTNPTRGMSKLTALCTVVSQSNAGYEANNKLLQNGGAKGILSLLEEINTEGTDTEEQLGQLKDKYYSTYAGPANNGKIVITGQKFSWINMGMSAVDLDLISSQKMSLRDICNVYGFQSQILNDPDNKTFANMRDAYKDLIESVIIPGHNSYLSQLDRHLLPFFEKRDGKKYTLEIDKSVYPELAADMLALSNALKGSYWLTPNEQRAAMGRAASDDPLMDTQWFPSSLIPINTPTETDGKALQYYLNSHAE